MQELDAAADWLRDQVREVLAGRVQHGTLRAAAWRDTQPRLLGKLPELAAQLDRALAIAVSRGHICVAQSELDMSTSTRGVFYAKARWRKAKPSDDEVKELHDRLQVAARAPADREHALRLTLGDPVALAQSAFARYTAPAPAAMLSDPDSTPPNRATRRSMTR